MSGQTRFVRSQRKMIVSGVLSIVLILLVLQIWLFTATMSGFLEGDDGILMPAALVSLTCLLLCVGLLRYLYRMER